MQLRLRPESSSTTFRRASSSLGVGDGGGSAEAGADLKPRTGGSDSGEAAEAKHGDTDTAPGHRRRHAKEMSDKFPSIFQKMTEGAPKICRRRLNLLSCTCLRNTG